MTTREIWEKLNEQLPERFPVTFYWKCSCEADNSGFPGCASEDCLTTRVYTALFDFYQMKETIEQNALKSGVWSEEVWDMPLTYEFFSEEGKAAFDVDTLTALTILSECGVVINDP